MKAGAPAAPRDIACEMTAATPGPGVATAKKYATQKVASPYHDMSTPVERSLRYSMLSPCKEMSSPSRSCSSVTRNPSVLSMAIRIT